MKSPIFLLLILWLGGVLVTLRQACIQDMSFIGYCQTEEMRQEKRNWVLERVQWEEKPLCLKQWEKMGICEK